MISFAQFGFNRLNKFFIVGAGTAAKAADDLAVTGDEELVEIPADLSGEFGIGLLRG
jgi:hypothetical protein